MKTKWYISTLVILFSLIGAVTQQQTTVPNQEIVLQFSDASITPQDTQSTIVIVKKQLQDLGASNIQVKQAKNGKLKITYYSDTDVSVIKETFAKEKGIAIDYGFDNENKIPQPLPVDEDTISYNLDVYEIQNGNDIEWDFNGISVVELKSESNRFSNPNIFAFTNTFELNQSIEKVAYKLHYTIATAIDNTSHNIPEVRAGPLS